MTTAKPANLPAGTSITSPGRSRSSEAITSARRSARRLREAVFSASPDPAAQRGVLHEVAEVAGRRLGVPVERLLALAQLPGEPDHGLVGLELRERLLEQLARALAAELVRRG